MADVLEFKSPREYSAKPFSVHTVYGAFKIAGTVCGNIDVAIPQGLTYALTPDELGRLIEALTKAREDVILNSRPETDPRLV